LFCSVEFHTLVKNISIKVFLDLVEKIWYIIITMHQ
jgi:hypothetical protein